MSKYLIPFPGGAMVVPSACLSSLANWSTPGDVQVCNRQDRQGGDIRQAGLAGAVVLKWEVVPAVHADSKR